jgi:hypothetical protein
MDTPMNIQEIEAFQEKLSQLIAAGNEAEVRAYIDGNFPRLPEDMQNDIAASMLTSSMEDEASEIDVITDLQEKGLAAATELETMKAELEKGNGGA